MKKIYIYPSDPQIGQKKIKNPYITNFSSSLKGKMEIITLKRRTMAGLDFLRCSIKSDIIIANWVESISSNRAGVIQFLLASITLLYIKISHKKLVWMVHNMQPHEGRSVFSDVLSKELASFADVIITHSQDAVKLVHDKYGKHSFYRCHPITPFQYGKSDTQKSIDILIWGTIIPYKGISEFISSPMIQKSNYQILISGICTDKSLENKILEYCNDHIIFKNVRMDFNKIQALINNSRYVVFPYKKDSVSSSGVLIDTIAMGGTPIGPHRGAFKDLQDEGVCIKYKNEDELCRILSGSHQIDNITREQFVQNNSWESFADFILELIN